MGGDVDQVRSVDDGKDLDPLGQDLGVQLVDLFVDDVLRLFPFKQFLIYIYKLIRMPINSARR